jgi:hypothetical protein
MMKALQFLLFITLYPIICLGQINGARNYALGNTFLTQKDILSAATNISKLSSIHALSIGLSSKNEFLIKELQQSSISVGLPLLKGYAAISIHDYGFALYRETQFSVAYSFALSPIFSMGLKIVYHHLFIAENNANNGTIYPNIGMSYRVNKKMELSVLLTNITLTKLTKSSMETWPISANIGTKYVVNNKLNMYLESTISLQQKISLRYGIEYLIKPILTLRTGINSATASFSMGVGLHLTKFSIDLASSYQAFIGFSPSISIRFEADN